MQLDVELDLLGLAQKDLGAAELVVVAVQVERQEKVPDVGLAAHEALGQEHAVQLGELVVGQPDVEAGLPDSHGLQHAGVSVK